MAKKNNSEVDDLIKNLSDPMWRICSGKLYKIIIKGDDDSEGLVIPFIPNRAQRRFIKRLHHRNLILKARQLGFTTLISILWLDHAQFNANSRCGIVAQDREAAEAIFRDKVKFAYENQPQAIKDMFPLAKESATEILFAHNNSSIRVATSLRSGTIHRLHVSEFGKICRKYPEKAREVITGSIPAVPMSGITIIESTAEGAEGYFHDMVQQALRLKDADKDLTEKDYRIHFYAWWDAPDYIASQEVQDTIFIEPDLHAYFDKIEVDMKTTIALAQRAWYVMTLGSDFNNVRELMYQEYPSTPQEAFHVSAEGLIYADQMTQMRKQGRILKIPIVNNPVYTFWDIGNTDGTAIWFMQRVGMEDRFIDYWEERDADYSRVMKVLQDKGYLWAKHYLPHDAEHRRQGIVNLSAKEMLESLGLRNIEIVERVDTIQNGINLTKYAFPEIFIDEDRCHLGIKRLDNYKKKWNNTLGLYSGEPLHDHNSEGADALRQYAQAKASGLIQSPNSNTFKRKSGSNWRTA